MTKRASFCRALKLGLIVAANLLFLSAAQAVQQDIWLAPRTDGQPGTGTPTDPFDVSTTQKFDDRMKLYGTPATLTNDITFHLAPGTYHTLGSYDNYGFDNWGCGSNWKFRGAGKDATIIKLDGYRYLGASKHAFNAVIQQFPWFQTGIEVTNLTVDCNWTGFGSRLVGSFIVPASGASVTATVADASKLTVGKYAFLQRMNNYEIVGLYEVVSKSGNNVVLTNMRGYEFSAVNNLAAGSVVDAAQGEVFVGPALNTCGLNLGAKYCIVENVRVTNTGTPYNEAPSGIAIAHISNGAPTDPFLYAEKNVVRNCIVEMMWGIYGWGISLVSNNPDTGDTGNFISGIVENNLVIGNGWHSGMNCFGVANSVYRNNVIRNCQTGWFIDSGYNQDILISVNRFLHCRVGVFFGGGDRAGNGTAHSNGGWSRITVLDNDIEVPQGSDGIFLNGEIKQCLFIGNYITAEPGVTSGYGIRMYSNVDTRNANAGNLFANNVVSSVLQNVIPQFGAYGFSNTTLEQGAPLTFMTGSSPFIDDLIRAWGNNAFTGANVFPGTTGVGGPTTSSGWAIQEDENGVAKLTLSVAGSSKWSYGSPNVLSEDKFDFTLFNEQTNSSALAINANTNEVTLTGNLVVYDPLQNWEMLQFGKSPKYMQLGRHDGTYAYVETVDSSTLRLQSGGDALNPGAVDIRNAWAFSHSANTALTVQRSSAHPARYLDLIDNAGRMIGQIDREGRMSIPNLVRQPGDPNGSAVGSVGDLYQRADGVSGKTLFVKEEGTNNDTGWRRVATVGGTILTVVVQLDFPSIRANSTSPLSVNVPGAEIGDAVAIGFPPEGPINVIYNGTVERLNSVSVRAHNPTGSTINPRSGSFTVTVIKH